MSQPVPDSEVNPWIKGLREMAQPLGATLMCTGTVIFAVTALENRDDWRGLAAVMLIWIGARLLFWRPS